MSLRTRRELFRDVGRGMIAAAVGTSLAADLGFAFSPVDEGGHITFGDLEPLVSFLQETSPDKLLPKVAEKLKSGTDLKTFVAAAALANARAFGGEDYVGFHTLMALAPAYKMALEEPHAERQPLAVMKVLVRNSTRLQEMGGKKAEVLKPIEAAKLAADRPNGEQLRDAARKADMAAAEATFAAICGQGKPQDALDALLVEVDDATEVHRVVLVSRAWDLINFVGAERAHTMLRQSVHYCVKAEGNPNQAKYNQPVREMLPKLLDQYKLIGMKPGTKSAEDSWVEKFANTVFAASAAQAGEAVAAALAEGISAEAVGEALSLAANQLVLRDEGRPKEWTAAKQTRRKYSRRLDRRPRMRHDPRVAEPLAGRRPPYAGHEPHPGRLQCRPRPRQPGERVPEVGSVSSRRAHGEGEKLVHRFPDEGTRWRDS